MMVLLVIALFLLGLLLGMQISEWFEKRNADSNYWKGYDDGYMDCESSINENEKYPHKAFKNANEVIQQLEDLEKGSTFPPNFKRKS